MAGVRDLPLAVLPPRRPEQRPAVQRVAVAVGEHAAERRRAQHRRGRIPGGARRGLAASAPPSSDAPAIYPVIFPGQTCGKLTDESIDRNYAAAHRAEGDLPAVRPEDDFVPVGEEARVAEALD